VGSGRLEDFSDGVIAIIITIMVLQLQPPEEPEFSALRPLLFIFVSYILSFVTIGIYWNNHHHLFQAAERVNGAILWANMHLLFWLSLIPFVTAWMGQNDFAKTPVALYGANLVMAALAYSILVRALVGKQPPGSDLVRAIRGDLKGKLSVVGYFVGVPIALVAPWAAFAIYVAVSLAWFFPDRRIERVVSGRDEQDDHDIHEITGPPQDHSADPK